MIKAIKRCNITLLPTYKLEIFLENNETIDTKEVNERNGHYISLFYIYTYNSF